MVVDTAEIKVGFKCNNNCRFCLVPEKMRGNELSFNEVKKQILEAKKLGAKTIILTGGEVTIRQDFFELCEYVNNENLELEIQTNGRIISYEWFLNRLKNNKIKRIIISLHGSDQETHNYLTRSQSFDQTLKGIKNIKTLGIFIVINIVLNKHNINNLIDISKLLNEIGVNQIQFSWIRPSDRTIDTFENLVPKYNEIVPNIKKSLDYLSKNEKIIVVTEGIPNCIIGEEYQKFVIEISDKINFFIDSVSISNKFRNNKTKLACCTECILNKECSGAYQEYIKRFGEDEFKPIKEIEKLS